MSGLGAWSFGFYSYGMQVPNNRVAAGITAFKQALIDNGMGKGIDLSLPIFGSNMKRRTVDFQKANSIGTDGIIGPTTSRYLFRVYSHEAELTGTIEIPDHLLHKLGAEESGHDPVAQGFFDPSDEGWAQINLISHPKITQLQAWSPGFAIPWAAKYLKTFYVDKAADWDGALASYNIGTYYAQQWVQAGKPAANGWFLGIDMWARATNYVAGVKSRDS
jgi:hypothetical protein